jgi:hypothetical protein
MIGHIKEVKVEDGQVISIIETGSGPAVTATIMPMGALDFQPLPGDSVLFHRAGKEIAVSAVFSEDNQAGPGEAVLFSRQMVDKTISITAMVHLKSDGKIELKPGAGKAAEVGTGSDAVAKSTPLDTYLSALLTAVAPSGTPIVTPAPGATCPVAVAIKAAMMAAFPPAGSGSCGSTNLKAD